MTILSIAELAALRKAGQQAGPFIGPRGGKWADPKHTIPWTARESKPAPVSRETEKPKPAASEPESDDEARLRALSEQMKRDSLGIPREKMPQIRSFHREEWLQQLREKGIESHRTEVKASDLKPTQAGIGPKLAGGQTIAENAHKPILVSNDGYILDGHHRWAFMRTKHPDQPIPAVRINAPIRALLKLADEFPKVEYAEMQKAIKQPSLSPTKQASPQKPSKEERKAQLIDAGFDKQDVKDFVGKTREVIPGGLARDRDPRRYDPKQLARGIAVEMEHTNDRRIAQEIAMDHLTEDPDYYVKLARVEKSESKGGPFIGPKGGKWADAQHTIPWKPEEAKEDPSLMLTLAPPGKNHGIGPESGKPLENGIGKHVSPHGSTRYLKYENGSIVGGLQVVHAAGRKPQLANAYVLSTHRRRGIANALLKRAKADHGDIARANYESEDAKRWLASHTTKSDLIPKAAITAAPRFVIQSARLAKADAAPGHQPAGGGWMPIPRGVHGGFRKRHGAGWIYWYPKTGISSGVRNQPAEWSETHFAEGTYDTDPTHWHFVRAAPGQTAITAWTQGGVDPHSNHPVKIAGIEGRLWRIKNPEHDHGWAELVDVNNVHETRLVRHDRVYPVEYGIRAPAATAKPKAPVWEPGTKPEGSEPTGPVIGSEKKIPAWPQSTARAGSYLAKIEGGIYPSRDVRRYEPDADGTPRIVRMRTVAMPETDKLGLLAEFAPLVRKIARSTSRTFGLADDAIPDVQSAALEGMLVAIDSYPGATSFGRHAGSIATDYARMHAAKEFAGGFAMPRRHARLLRTFIAAKATAARSHETGAPTPEHIAEAWRIRKRDVHPGLEKQQGRDDLIPMNRYTLKGGQFAPGNAYPGRVEWAEHMSEFLAGQHKAEGSPFLDDPAIFGGAESVGAGLPEHEKEFIRYAIGEALDALRNHRVTIGKREWKADAAALIRGRLGLETAPEETLTLAKHVPIYWLDRKGMWRQASPRRASRVVDAIVDDALHFARQSLGGEAAGAIDRARRAVLPTPAAPHGPTAGERFRALARAVTRDEVREWRRSERERLRKLAAAQGDDPEARALLAGRLRYLNGIGFHRARNIVAQRKLFSTPRALSWFRTAIPADVQAEAPRGRRYVAGTVTVTDPSTGRQRHLRVQRLQDVRKSEAESDMQGREVVTPTADDAVFATMQARYPNLCALLFAANQVLADMPGRDRDQVLELMGYA